jgi:hypothetical protein
MGHTSNVPFDLIIGRLRPLLSGGALIGGRWMPEPPAR